MNKADLLSKISEDANISKSQASDALDSVVKNITEALKQGDKVSLVGFGTFSVTHREARTGRNPQTGDAIQIAAKNVAKFKPGKELSDQL